jgi:hypothetical protein
LPEGGPVPTSVSARVFSQRQDERGDREHEPAEGEHAGDDQPLDEHEA